MALDGTVQRQLGGRAAVISSLKFLGGAAHPVAVLSVANTGDIAEINMSLKLLILSFLVLSFLIPSFLIPNFLIPRLDEG